MCAHRPVKAALPLAARNGLPEPGVDEFLHQRRRAGTRSLGGSVPDEYLTCCADAGVALAPRIAAPAVTESPRNTSRRYQPICSIVSSRYASLTSVDHRWFQARVAPLEHSCNDKKPAFSPAFAPGFGLRAVRSIVVAERPQRDAR